MINRKIYTAALFCAVFSIVSGCKRPGADEQSMKKERPDSPLPEEERQNNEKPAGTATALEKIKDHPAVHEIKSIGSFKLVSKTKSGDKRIELKPVDTIQNQSPEIEACMKKCVQNNMMRAVAPEVIESDCEKECKKH